MIFYARCVKMRASRPVQDALTSLIQVTIGLYGHYVDPAPDGELFQHQLPICRRVAQPSLTLRIIFEFIVDPITDVKAGQRGPMDS